MYQLKNVHKGTQTPPPMQSRGTLMKRVGEIDPNPWAIRRGLFCIKIEFD